MRLVVLSAMAAAALLAGCAGEAPAPQPTLNESRSAALEALAGAAFPYDFTVVSKTLYNTEGTSGKRGYYVTIILFEQERETAVPRECYEAARVGEVLPVSAPGTKYVPSSDAGTVTARPVQISCR